MGHLIFVVPTQLFYYSAKETTDNTYMNVTGCVQITNVVAIMCQFLF